MVSINENNSHQPRRPRAKASGRRLTSENAAIAKGMLDRGERQSDIAAHFKVNQGRIAEIASGIKFVEVQAATLDELPPSAVSSH